MGHGVVLAEYYANALAGSGLPAPLMVTRLLLLLGDALDALPVDRAVELVAWSICDAECRGGDDPEHCMDECTAARAVELRKLLERHSGAAHGGLLLEAGR